jgi:two-component sensor histidine kinase
LIPNSEKSGASEKFQGFIYDISQRKMAEETLARNEEVRIKEIHHRIKNNLQVISSLLSLQADKLNNRNAFQPSDIFEAFRESQNRIVSMALIHEELYQGKGFETLEFAAYLRRLTAELLKSYTIGNENISLKLEIEPVYLDMDTAVPLGIIVNELVSNSLKHAFPENKEKEIIVSLFGSENYKKESETKNYGIESGKDNADKACCKNEKNLQFTLIVADNGKGIPEEIDFKNTDSLGLQLVNILVEQIDGCIELIRGAGTEFKIGFKTQEK